MRIEKIIEYLFYMFVFLLPWQTVFLVREIFVGGEKWEYGTIGLYLSDVVLMCLLLLVGVSKLNRITQNSKLKDLTLWEITQRVKNHNSKIKTFLSFKIPSHGLRVTSYALVLWTFVSVFWAPDEFLAIYFSFKMLLGVGLFFAIREIKFDWKKLMFVLILGALIQAGLGTWQYLAQDTFSSKWLGMSEYDASKGGVSVLENESGRWLRAYGGMPHPNMLGGYLALIILIIIKINFQDTRSKIQIISNNQFSKRKEVIFFALMIVVSCLLVAGLLFSFSRSAWVALVAGLIINVSFFQKCSGVISWQKLLNLRYMRILSFLRKAQFLKKALSLEDFFKKETFIIRCKKFEFIVLMMAFIVLIIGINHENFFSRFDATQRLEQKSVSDRVSYFSQASEIISENSLLGVGVGNYTLEVMKNDELKRGVWEYQPVHNVFLLVFAELGLVGFVLFGLALISIIARANSGHYPIFAALFVFAMLDHWLWTSHFGLLFFWLVLGLMCADGKSKS